MVQSNNIASYTEDEVVPSATVATTKSLHSDIHQNTIERYGNMIVKNWVEYE